MMDYLREQVALLKNAGWITHANEFAECVRSLRVIHTWASVDGGRLNAADVKNMAEKALAPFMQHQATRKQ
jgi:hypothetical protein